MSLSNWHQIFLNRAVWDNSMTRRALSANPLSTSKQEVGDLKKVSFNDNEAETLINEILSVLQIYLKETEENKWHYQLYSNNFGEGLNWNVTNAQANSSIIKFVYGKSMTEQASQDDGTLSYKIKMFHLGYSALNNIWCFFNKELPSNSNELQRMNELAMRGNQMQMMYNPWVFTYNDDRTFFSLCRYDAFDTTLNSYYQIGFFLYKDKDGDWKAYANTNDKYGSIGGAQSGTQGIAIDYSISSEFELPETPFLSYSEPTAIEEKTLVPLIPIITTKADSHVTASKEGYWNYDTHYATYAFNGIIKTEWEAWGLIHPKDETNWICYEFDTPVIPHTCGFGDYCGDNVGTCTFTFEFSNDKQSWDILAGPFNYKEWYTQIGLEQRIHLDNPNNNQYKYFRFVINGNSRADNFTLVSFLQVYAEEKDTENFIKLTIDPKVYLKPCIWNRGDDITGPKNIENVYTNFSYPGCAGQVVTDQNGDQFLCLGAYFYVKVNSLPTIPQKSNFNPDEYYNIDSLTGWEDLIPGEPIGQL